MPTSCVPSRQRDTLINCDRERLRYDSHSMGQQHAQLSGASSNRDRTALIGSLVAAYAVFDALAFLIVIITLAAIFNPFLVFVGASVVVTITMLQAARGSTARGAAGSRKDMANGWRRDSQGCIRAR